MIECLTLWRVCKIGTADAGAEFGDGFAALPAVCGAHDHRLRPRGGRYGRALHSAGLAWLQAVLQTLIVLALNVEFAARGLQLDL